jgi:hypothetical protein
MDFHPATVRAFAEKLEVIVNGEIPDGPPKIVQEPIADGPAVHDAAGEHRQEGQQVVTAPAFEFIPQTWRPVENFHFPTVGVQVFQRPACP